MDINLSTEKQFVLVSNLYFWRALKGEEQLRENVERSIKILEDRKTARLFIERNFTYTCYKSFKRWNEVARSNFHATNDKTADMNNSKAEREEKTEPILTECYPQKMKS
ncbi:unnamed protein product [Rhizophagus irregularis]|nr:unnamed protein product [Rhizophagus irregularis]CAB5384731.1 unnamed protein product [Rhizophagus irregularis]